MGSAFAGRLADGLLFARLREIFRFAMGINNWPDRRV
jgi:hypothetical protein